MALHFIVLLLTTVLFSKALALKCYGNITDPVTGTWSNLTNVCLGQCNSMTRMTFLGDLKLNQSIKLCGDPYSCLNGSINYGQSRVTVNSLCCGTDYCNSQFPPAYPRFPVNGKTCYTCNNTDCSKVLACEGDENQCFTSTVAISGKNQTQKGCASKLFCLNIGFNENKCCNGNLCNSAQSIRAFFIPLLSLIFLFFV
ncbi:urokinase plasminogen activator surface receptor-like [Paramisgurnus dabryanus]|uniref:urokinase plasminogen activator surface receptor-like n=1 Tax=Paramisgurnus dabryanus TaxID=90735 RepID=UPI003CCFA094